MEGNEFLHFWHLTNFALVPYALNQLLYENEKSTKKMIIWTRAMYPNINFILGRCLQVLCRATPPSYAHVGSSKPVQLMHRYNTPVPNVIYSSKRGKSAIGGHDSFVSVSEGSRGKKWDWGLLGFV